MSLPSIGQAQMLADYFERLIAHYRPVSVGLAARALLCRRAIDAAAILQLPSSDQAFVSASPYASGSNCNVLNGCEAGGRQPT